MNLKVNYLFILLFTVFSCSEAEDDFEVLDEEKIRENYETKYNNEYIKIIDEDLKNKKPQKRLINADAPLRLGIVKISIDNIEKEINTFKKGSTDMHMSDKGLRLRIHDMYDFKLSIFLKNKDILKKAKNTYTASENEKNLTGEISYYDKIEKQPVEYNWIKGKAVLSDFSPGLGTVNLSISGKAKKVDNDALVEINISISMNFEEVTSSVGING